MSMKHPGRHHARAAASRRAKEKQQKAEKRALRERLSEAKKAEG